MLPTRTENSMRNPINSNKKYSQYFYLLSGFIISVLLMLPYCILGTDSIVTYHDQLDGEILSYILRAKYLFTGTHVYPELMNGIPDTGLVPPAPLFVVFYRFFSPFTAFLFSQWLISIIGFTGMYLLLQRLSGQQLISFLIACIFMLLPFYPVYGLCIPGQPLMLYSVLQLVQSEADSRPPFNVGNILSLSCILFYALGSSLILVGFGWLVALGLWLLCRTLHAIRNRQRPPYAPAMAFAALLIGYLTCNISLIRQVLFPAPGELSHKSEIVHNATEFWESIKLIIYPGVSYTETWHWIVIPFILSCLLLLISAKLRGQTNYFRQLLRLTGRALPAFGFIVSVVLFCGIYEGPALTALKDRLPGALGSFNLSRFTWLLPTWWCIFICLLCSAILAPKCVENEAKGQQTPHLKTKGNPINHPLRQLFIVALLGLWAITILWNSPLKANVSRLIKGSDYYALDWNRFFAEDIFCQIDEAIDRPKEDYRVVSIGIYPSAAAYNGFYCLDAYSNNYPLSYKHEFREVIAGELEKSPYLREYYDNWGNRCYMATSEVPGYYTFEKKWNTVLTDLNLNTGKLKEMHCDYIFSAAYLANSDELGITLLRDEPFETSDSWYHIYVYEIH